MKRLKQLLNMIPFEANNSHIVLDIGCGKGLLSYVLSSEFQTIGLDIRRTFKPAKTHGCSQKPNFVLADLSFLPFRRTVIDVVVCGSVLEHIKLLDSSIKEIKRVLKQKGVLIAGYPVETRVFKFLWKLISPRDYKLIDQSQSYFINPYTHKNENYWKCPSTHKQTYQSIRQVLKKYFRVVKKDKLPFRFFPDLISYYECLKVCKLK